MSKPGDNVGYGGLGCSAEFITSVQVHLDACGWIKAVEASTCTAKAYLDVLTGTGLEGQEGLNSFDAVFFAVAPTISVP